MASEDGMDTKGASVSRSWSTVIATTPCYPRRWSFEFDHDRYQNKTKQAVSFKLFL